MRLIKLDRRMTGYGTFKFMVRFRHTTEDFEKFTNMRTWCWEQWGPSCEYIFYKSVAIDKNPAWCWANYEFENRLYFFGDKEGSWFLLKWA